MKTKKNKIRVICIVAALLVVSCIAFVSFLYTHGMFNPAHRFQQPLDGQIRVACVGDSVTYGMNMKNWSANAYPFVLRELLGEKYCVNNYGFSGRTVGKSGDRPYTDEKLFQKSLDFKPDIVIIQIGSNDSKAFNWKSAESFQADFEELVKSYVNLDSKPQVFICTPPPAFAVNGKVGHHIEADTIKNEIAPAIREAAANLDVPLIDLHEIFDGKPEMFFDGLHLNPEGGKIFAETVFNEIKDSGAVKV